CAAYLGREAQSLRARPQRLAPGPVRAGRGAGAGARGPPEQRAAGAEGRARARAAVRREGARLPARRLLGGPGAHRRHAVHRAPRGRAVEVRVVAVRGHHLPLADRRDLGQRPAGVGWRAHRRRAAGTAAGVRSLMRWLRAFACALALCITGFASAQEPGDDRIVFPASVSQGALVFGKVPAGSVVEYAGRTLRPTPYGTVVFGVDRREQGPLLLEVLRADGTRTVESIAVTARDWLLEHVDGVPPKTVNPPPAIAERIRREQARVSAARTRDDDRADFAAPFTWPVQGRVSGRFGSGRVYNGQPGAGHSGMDIAAPTGTPVKAPAAGVVTFAADLYLTGGTILLDHGHGVSSN